MYQWKLLGSSNCTVAVTIGECHIFMMMFFHSYESAVSMHSTNCGLKS